MLKLNIVVCFQYLNSICYLNTSYVKVKRIFQLMKENNLNDLNTSYVKVKQEEIKKQIKDIRFKYILC